MPEFAQPSACSELRARRGKGIKRSLVSFLKEAKSKPFLLLFRSLLFCHSSLQSKSSVSVVLHIFTFISITYISMCIYTRILIETIHVLTSMFSTSFAPVRCATRVIRNTTKRRMAREWVAVAASKLPVKSASSLPERVCQKMIVRKTKLSSLFWNNIVALSLTSLLYFSNWQH